VFSLALLLDRAFSNKGEKFFSLVLIISMKFESFTTVAECLIMPIFFDSIKGDKGLIGFCSAISWLDLN